MLNDKWELLNFKLNILENYDLGEYKELSWEEYQSFLKRLDTCIDAIHID